MPRRVVRPAADEQRPRPTRTVAPPTSTAMGRLARPSAGSQGNSPGQTGFFPPGLPPPLLGVQKFRTRRGPKECSGPWATRSLRVPGLRHPRELGTPAGAAFRTDLAVQGHVARKGPAGATSPLDLLHELTPEAIKAVAWPCGPRRQPAFTKTDPRAEVKHSPPALGTFSDFFVAPARAQASPGRSRSQVAFAQEGPCPGGVGPATAVPRPRLLDPLRHAALTHEARRHPFVQKRGPWLQGRQAGACLPTRPGPPARWRTRPARGGRSCKPTACSHDLVRHGGKQGGKVARRGKSVRGRLRPGDGG